MSTFDVQVFNSVATTVKKTQQLKQKDVPSNIFLMVA